MPAMTLLLGISMIYKTFYYRKHSVIALLLLLGLLLSACSSSVTTVSSLIGGRVKYDYAQNFESMQKYNFMPAPAAVKNNPDYQFIHSQGATLAIENTMASKKIRKERYAVPDFLVNYYFVGKKGISVGQLNKLYGYNLGLTWDDEYGTGKGIANTSHIFSEATFIVDLISSDGNRLIWRGSVPTSIDRDNSEDENRKLLHKAVDVILDSFPPENYFKSLKDAAPL